MVPEHPLIPGIREAYPRLPVSAKLRAYIQAARPFTLLAPIVGVACAAAMAVGYGYTGWSTVFADWRLLVFGAATLLLAQIGSNFVNQGTDTAEDLVNRAWRPVPSGAMGAEEATTIGHVLWFLAILRAATLGAAFGVLVTLIVGISYAYSTTPLRLKQRPWWGNVSIAVARGLLGIVAAWTLFAPWNAPEPWAAGVVLFLFLVGAATSKDFADEEGDRQAGVRNLVVEYGAKKAALMSLPFALSPLSSTPILAGLGFIHVNVWAYVAASAVVVFFCWSMMFQQAKQNKTLEASRPWAVMYASLLVLMAMLASVAIPSA